jgi:hypothetical protein
MFAKILKGGEGSGRKPTGIHADVLRTGKTHAELAQGHRAYAKQMHSVGQHGLATRSESLAAEHEAFIKSGT